MGAIERAKIYELDASGKSITPGIDVCFNPKEYQLDKAVAWAPSKAHEDAPMPEFGPPAGMTLSVTLQFDTYEERVSVRDKYIRRLEKLTFMVGKAKDEKDAKKHAPPRVLFVWGNFTFRCVIQSLGQKYTMFLADGTPVRCECALKMLQVQSESEAMETTTNNMAGKTGSTATMTGSKTDRLDLIAADKLGDASRWSEIAALSGIDDPTKSLENVTITYPVD